MFVRRHAGRAERERSNFVISLRRKFWSWWSFSAIGSTHSEASLFYVVAWTSCLVGIARHAWEARKATTMDLPKVNTKSSSEKNFGVMRELRETWASR